METAITERQSRTVFITGAGTAVGLAAVKALAGGGHKVTGTVTGSKEAADVRSRGGLPINVQLNRQSEVEAAMRMAKPEIVVHLGTQTPNQIPFADVGWDGNAILQMTNATLESAIAVGAKFFVHGSYAFVYGDQHGHWVDETARAHGDVSDLIKSALRAEKAALTAAIPACVLRFGFIYGLQSPVINSVVETIRKGRSVVGGDGILNWVYANDAGEAIRIAAEAQPTGEILNIVDNNPATATAFIGKLATSMGVSAPGRASEFRSPVGKTGLDLLKNSARARNAHAREVLGWMPQYPDQIQGIEDILLSWRASEFTRQA